MKLAYLAAAVFVFALAGCSDAARARAEADAEAAREAQAKAEAELAQVKAEAELAKNRTGSVEVLAPPELVAPRLLAPADGSVRSDIPRKTKVQWVPVIGAAAYKVEVEYQDPDMQWHLNGAPTVTGLTEYEFEFVGAQPGRWRVGAVDANGQEGPKSDWWNFRYSQ